MDTSELLSSLFNVLKDDYVFFFFIFLAAVRAEIVSRSFEMSSVAFVSV